MAFPAFDLAKAIQQHNEIYGVRIPETATFGFHFFANDAKKFVQEREEYIHDLAAIFVFSKKDSLAYKVLKQDKNNSSSADIDVKADDFKSLHRLSVIAMNFRYFKKLHDRFNQQNFWQSHRGYVDLETLWQAQQEFALVSNRGMAFLADRLEELAKHFERARKQLNKDKKIPPFIWLEYSDYIDNYVTEINRLKQSAIASMQHRLTLFENGYPAMPMAYMAHQLRWELTGRFIPKYLDNLNEKQFYRFKQFIQRHGSVEQKQNDVEHHWVGRNRDFVRVGNTIVPKDFKERVPDKPPRLPFLRPGKQFRYQFFKEKEFLFTALQRLPTAYGFSLAKVDEVPAVLEHIAKMIKLCDKHRTPVPAGLWHRLFHQQTSQFVEDWNEQVQCYRALCLMRECDLAEQMVNAIRDLDLDKLDSIPWDKFEKVKKYMKEIDNHIGQFPKEGYANQRIRDIHNELYARLSHYEILYKNFFDIADGKPHTIQDIKNVYRTLEHLQRNQPEAFNAFKERYSYSFQGIIQQAKAMLAQKEFSLERLRALIPILHLIDENALQHSFIKYFHTYLAELSQLGTKCQTLPESIQFQEQILQEFAPLIDTGKSTIGSYLAELNSTKRDNTIIFMKIKAKALLELEGGHSVQKRLEKDTTTLDTKLFARIATTELGNTDEKLAIWQRLHQGVLSGKDLNQLKQQLNSMEQLLIGVNNPHTQATHQDICQLLQLSRITHEEITKDKKGFHEKQHTQARLATFVSNHIKNNGLTKNHLPCFTTAKKRHTLFGKPFIAQQALNHDNKPIAPANQQVL